MSKPIEAIFHAKFTCIGHDDTVTGNSIIEYYHYSQNKNDFWTWINSHNEELQKEFKTVLIDSINMI